MDIILYNIIACLLSFILGYFFGSIPVGVILCKTFYHSDPRENGSKNSGGTNVGRLFGKKIGLATIILDGIKTVIPMILVWILINYAGIRELFVKNLGQEMYHYGYTAIILAPLGATVGHCWPIFAGYRGGKAVSSFAGFELATCWAGSIVGAISFFTTLKLSKHVSLSSIISSGVCAVFSWVVFIINSVATNFNANFFFWGFGNTPIWVAGNLEFSIVSTLMFLLLVFRHRFNIKRLVAGTESKIKWMK